MIQAKQVLTASPRSLKSLKRSERHAMHRSADAYLEMERIREQLNQAAERRKYTPGPIAKYLTLLADGLEHMYGTFIK